MKTNFSTNQGIVSNFDPDITFDIMSDIKMGVRLSELYKKYSGYEDLVDFYWERL